MARKPFDPFDERHRDKVKRRRPHEVAAEERAWRERVDNHFRRAMDEVGWFDYIDSECITIAINCNMQTNVSPEVIRRNFRASMERLGYYKYVNEKSKDGRWKFGEQFLVVYAKRGSPRISRSELKQALDR